MRNGFSGLTHAYCFVVFMLYNVFFLFFFHAETFACVQHILSGGATTYSPIIGGIVVTIFLTVISVLLIRFFTLSDRMIALGYFPACLILPAITCLSFTGKHDCRNLTLLMILMFLSVIAIVFFHINFGRDRGTFSDVKDFVESLLSNTLLFIFVISCSGFFSNTDEVFIYETTVEQYCKEGRFKEAAELGRRSEATSVRLTALRAYALARQVKLGDRLFEYSLPSGHNCLLIPRNDSVRMFQSPDVVYRFLGAYPAEGMSEDRYLAIMSNDTLARDAVKDYYLCHLLLRKDLQTFASCIGRYYDLSRKMPKHYEEALVLYCRLRTNPVVTYTNSAVETNYDEYVDMHQKNKSEPQKCKNLLRREFGKTYWWYYNYH